MSVNQRTKEKKEDSITFVALLYLIQNLVFDNFIQFLYISLLKGTVAKYDIYYNGFVKIVLS